MVRPTRRCDRAAARASEDAGRRAVASRCRVDGPRPRVHRPAGYPHNHDRVRRAFYSALKAAKVRQVVLYALRHTMATLVLHETKNLKLVATRLGHSNEMLVLRTYGHLLPGVDREAANRLGEVVKRQLHDHNRDGFSS